MEGGAEPRRTAGEASVDLTGNFRALQNCPGLSGQLQDGGCPREGSGV